MSALKGKSSKKPVDVLKDDELSELTKKEIEFWSQKLNVTPSQLFSMPKDELDAALKNCLSAENDAQKAKKQSSFLEQVEESQNKIAEFKKKARLGGGQVRPICEILAQAAADMEEELGLNMWNESQEVVYDQNSAFDETYDVPPPNDQYYSDGSCSCSDEQSYEQSYEQSFDPFADLSSTLYYTALDTTPEGTCDASAFSNHAPADGTYVRPDGTFNVAAPHPDSCMNNDLSRSSIYRTITDYKVEYNQGGRKETSNRVSIENNQGSGKVTSSTHTFTVPANNLSSDLDVPSPGMFRPVMSSTPVPRIYSPPGPSGLQRNRQSSSQYGQAGSRPSSRVPTSNPACRKLF